MKRMTLNGWSLTEVVVAGLIIWFIARRFYPGNPKDERFIVDALGDIANQLSASFGIESNVLKEMLINWQRTGDKPEPLRDFVKIECSFLKKSPAVVAVSFRVAQKAKDEEKVKITTFSREFGWEYLPQEIRSEFIMNSGDECHYVLCGSVPQSQQST